MLLIKTCNLANVPSITIITDMIYYLQIIKDEEQQQWQKRKKEGKNEDEEMDCFFWGRDIRMEGFCFCLSSLYYVFFPNSYSLTSSNVCIITMMTPIISIFLYVYIFFVLFKYCFGGYGIIET